MISFIFDPKTAIEAILYIAHRVNDPTFHRISKIMYFADKTHLARYGRFICGDHYVAMKHGPVPGGLYDILKDVRYHRSSSIVDKAHKAFTVEQTDRKPYVKPAREADLAYFSESDLECLDEAIERYGTLSFKQLTTQSHDQAWDSADENDLIEIEQIISTFDNPAGLLEHLSQTRLLPRLPGSVSIFTG